MVIPYKKTAIFITGLVCLQAGLLILGVGLILLAFIFVLDDA